MAKTTDDLEAVRAVVAALESFNADDQERIIRWAREKLGLAPAPRTLSDARLPQASAPVQHLETTEVVPAQVSAPAQDLKTFIKVKAPKKDIQFAAVVAYYYRFEAPPERRKDEIDAAVLQDACRLAGRNRFPKPDQTLRNAKNLGLLDGGSEAGRFAINTVGENLVAMALPAQSDGNALRSRRTARQRRQRKPTRKTRSVKK